MCPQANSSMLLLGGGIEGESKLLGLCSLSAPRSVVGYISDAILNRSIPDLSKYSVQVSSINSKVSPNLYLLSGDGNLELMAPAINDEASRTPFPGLADPWRWVHEIFKRMIDGLDQQRWTVFFDTNPSFAIYTELAICGATRILVPVNADDSHGLPSKPCSRYCTVLIRHTHFSEIIPLLQRRRKGVCRFRKFIWQSETDSHNLRGLRPLSRRSQQQPQINYIPENAFVPNRFSPRSRRAASRDAFLAMYVGNCVTSILPEL